MHNNDQSNHPTSTTASTLAATAPGQWRVIKRNGDVVLFDEDKISIAISKAFLAVEGEAASGSSRIHDRVKQLTEQVCATFKRRMPSGGTLHIEDIQDQVELALMRSGEHKIARSYVLYREQRAQQRAASQAISAEHSGLYVTLADGSRAPLDTERMALIINEACADLSHVNAQAILEEALKNLYDGIPLEQVNTSLVITARTMVERDPNYSKVTARLLLDKLRGEALAFLDIATTASQRDMATLYVHALPKTIKKAVELELLDAALLDYDLQRLAQALDAARDLQFNYLGLQTLYDRYFIHSEDVRFELPQVFFMRVAMGLAVNEPQKNERAIEFYRLLSSFDYMSSTPTLFNAGTLRPQLSSCYLTTIPDDLHGIYGALRDNAMLSKWAGGLGNDWTPVRALGSYIKGTNGKSQGTVPFMKVFSDSAVAVNQCFAPDTTVYTADGVKAIRDIKRGDLVLGQRGQYREVIEQMAYNQLDAMVEIRAKHALHPLRVTAGHPLWVIKGIPLQQGHQRSYDWLQKGKVAAQWVEAGQVERGDFVAQVIPQEIVPAAHIDMHDMRLYGILLGDGHCSKNGLEWGVSGNPDKDEHLDWVKNYLTERGMHYWEKNRRKNYLQIGWSANVGLAREATSGRFVRGNKPGFIFSRDDLYDADGNKRIAKDFTHLPTEQTLALIHGLLETDGGVSRGKEIYFTNTSKPLVEGLRYQLLRLGIPTAGQYRERQHTHSATRANGETIQCNNCSAAYDLRIPAVAKIARLVNCRPLKKHNWLQWQGCVFTRVVKQEAIAPLPFVCDLKVEGDASYMTSAALAHNGGKRKGAVCAYLETWHLDIEEFLELRKNTGDDRRRTHDMNTANWIPDLFMQRVFDDEEWTLFSPSDVPDLHDLYGKCFVDRYCYYENLAKNGTLQHFKVVRAQNLWRKMLEMVFETGHPWLTFKDPCNLRSPQQHVGVVHSSNLCTEITLNTSADEIAVCNLGSLNLAQHVDANGLDVAKLEKTVTTAIRMLDNVIDINYYPVPQAERSNLRHRPIGLGLMGFQDALYKQRIGYASAQAVEFADRVMETVSYFAIKASTLLAEERGAYSSFEGSLWSQGILPIDSLQKLIDERGADYIEIDQSTTLDWDTLRQQVKDKGMRNSNVLAIAPTATIANIIGVTQSIEPIYQNLHTKSTLSGEFTVLNDCLVCDLKERGLWDEVMVNDLKYYDGSAQAIDRIPDDLKALYATAFEVEPRWLVDCASRRQKWIDQAQSLNLYIAGASGKKLDITYRMAWYRGLKTTYYLRALAATSTEKSTVETGVLNAVAATPAVAPVPQACSIDDPECEACQ